MEAINQILSWVSQIFTWWFIVMPWEKAVFVRLGKKVKIREQGFYFKIPFIDRVYIQEIRLRALDLPIQTLSTVDGRTITYKGIIMYSIGDIYTLFNSISHPEMTIAGMTLASISAYIKERKFNELSIDDIETLDIEVEEYGLTNFSLQITSWAEVKTYRLIQDSCWMNEQTNMDYLGKPNN